MLFQTPTLGEGERNAIARIEDLYGQLEYALSSPKRWSGVLRRLAFARAIQQSNSIEGYNVSTEDAVAAIENEEPADANRDDWLAVMGYRNAMTYVMRLADDPHFEWNGTLIRSLHYMMISYDLAKHPGQWRPGPIKVRRIDTGEVVYNGPDAGLVPELIKELVSFLGSGSDHPPVVRAAMAHLNLTMIHPFSDGNGRMARALQTLVLAREGITSPVFSSIEEYLGEHTQDYYAVLAEVGAGSWNPDRDARPWLTFCLEAHFRCANRFLLRNKIMGALWEEINEITMKHKLHPRVDVALIWAAIGQKIRNSTYRSMADVSEFVAGRDLKLLTKLELLEAKGEKRGRYYAASDRLREITKRVMSDTSVPAIDPFAPFQPTFPGFETI